MKEMVGEEVFYKANGMPSPMLSCNIRILMLYASESSQLLMFLENWRFVNWESQVTTAMRASPLWSVGLYKCEPGLMQR